jgi:hypothetical protein
VAAVGQLYMLLWPWQIPRLQSDIANSHIKRHTWLFCSQGTCIQATPATKNFLYFKFHQHELEKQIPMN